ncbi:MAG TPA: hypothetical protein VGK34_01415, partial [Armatimonadota bacterium]
MSEQKLFFSTVKEDRGTYFVEYMPPNPGFQFATLCLVFPDPVTGEVAAQAMEMEARKWLARYPVPVFVSSFDAKDDLNDLGAIRSYQHLVAFLDKEDVRLFWKQLTNDETPSDALDTDFLKAVYAGIPWKTGADLRQEAEESAKKLRRGWIIVLLWFAVAPASWEILQWAGPKWLA